MADGSLSSVVSGLMRAQTGASVSSTVTDDDLDRHVAELILKEAKKKAEQYDQQGISAYLPQPESNVPKPNKRFLSSIIRHTDDHNKSILRAQVLSASEIRMEREAQMRAERRARAEEAAAAERARRSRRGRDDSRDRERKRRERSWDRYVSDEGEDRWQSSKRRRDDEEESECRDSRSARKSRRDEEGPSRRRRHRSRSPSDDEDKEKRRHRRRHASRSRSPDGTHDRSSRGGGEASSRRHRSRSPVDTDDEARLSRGKRRRRSSRSPGLDGSPEPDTRSRHKRRTHRHDTPRRRRHPSRSHSRTPDRGCRTSETLSEGLDAGHRPSGSRAASRAPLPDDPAYDLAQRESDLRRKLKGKAKASSEATSRHVRSRSRTPVLDPSPGPRDTTPKPPRSPSPGPRPPPGPPPPLPPPDDFSPNSIRPDLPSKMDKYFDVSYDPRLDVAPLVAPTVPDTGLINNAEFEGWDAMLELIKQRREDKAERKRLERLGLVEKSGKDKSKSKSKSKIAGLGVAGTLAGWSEGGNGLMDIEYKKRGSVREWDLGKETPT
ncbi:hypothetical protein BJV78DRAFT_1195592 [Lactifluus subvellereus]|nr:hypothetical protein BJV78DRAFT_1195592 [Lactifluus subvellereus]